LFSFLFTGLDSNSNPANVRNKALSSIKTPYRHTVYSLTLTFFFHKANSISSHPLTFPTLLPSIPPPFPSFLNLIYCPRRNVRYLQRALSKHNMHGKKTIFWVGSRGGGREGMGKEG